MKLPEKLLKNEACSASLVAVSPDAIISVDTDQRIHVFNPGAERIFGCRTEEVLGQLLPERFHEAHRAHLHAFAASPSHTQRMGDPGVTLDVIVAMFSPIDQFFYRLASYEGYKFSFRQITQAEKASRYRQRPSL